MLFLKLRWAQCAWCCGVVSECVVSWSMCACPRKPWLWMIYKRLWCGFRVCGELKYVRVPKKAMIVHDIWTVVVWFQNVWWAEVCVRAQESHDCAWFMNGRGVVSQCLVSWSMCACPRKPWLCMIYEQLWCGFRVFGELKYVRVPKKAGRTGIQGFAFVDFLTKQDAKVRPTIFCSCSAWGSGLVNRLKKKK